MYYLFLEHDIMPGDYYKLPAGEKVVLRAFFEKEMSLRYEGENRKPRRIR